MNKTKQSLTVAAFAASLMLAGPLYAGGKHSGDHHDEGGKDHHGASEHHDSSDGHHKQGMGKMFLVKKNIDGYDVSFHVMKAKPGKEMGGSHDFMIKVEKDGKPVNVVVNTKVVHPNGKAESKKTMKMGDWMMAGYDMDHGGKHQMMILFKTPDGKKHKGGVYYPGN